MNAGNVLMDDKDQVCGKAQHQLSPMEGSFLQQSQEYFEGGPFENPSRRGLKVWASALSH